MLQTQGEEQRAGEQVQSEELQMAGEEVIRHGVPGRGKVE